MARNNLFKRIELIANLSIIIACLSVGGVLINRYVLSNSASNRTGVAGTKISLPGVDWSKNRRTLMLALSQSCHSCSESASFYQRLVELAEGRSDIQLIAVLPQAANEAKKYLSELGVAIKDVRQAQLRSIQVKGTPTLLLIDQQGVVTNAWTGKLPPDKEAEVLNLMQCDTCGGESPISKLRVSSKLSLNNFPYEGDRLNLCCERGRLRHSISMSEN